MSNFQQEQKKVQIKLLHQRIEDKLEIHNGYLPDENEVEMRKRYNKISAEDLIRIFHEYLREFIR